MHQSLNFPQKLEDRDIDTLGLRFSAIKKNNPSAGVMQVSDI